MKIEIEVISTEIITPSSPTPNDVSNHKLSYIDQISPPIFVCLPLLYNNANTNLTKSEISSRLKQSLSKTLSLYYPLAGRLVDNNYVLCNDQGVTYIEAQANCTLLEVLNDPIPHEIDTLFPRKIVDNVSDNCSVIQATFFGCGGLSIGVALSHKLGDGWSISLFINRWAAISRGEEIGDTPLFNGATIFPPNSDLVRSNPETGGTISKEGIITKRFVFTAKKINALIDKYTNTLRATRIEALTAFILTRFMASTKHKDDPERNFSIHHAVNVRKRVVPPLSEDLFGNFVLPTKAVPVLENGEEQGTEIVQKLREAIRGVGGGDYVTTLQEGIQAFDPKTFSGEVVLFYFSSLCGFPIFEADFGWGKPVWSGAGTMSFKNFVSFSDSPPSSGGGIQAWVCLTVEDMAKFVVDQEVLAYIG